MILSTAAASVTYTDAILNSAIKAVNDEIRLLLRKSWLQETIQALKIEKAPMKHTEDHAKPITEMARCIPSQRKSMYTKAGRWERHVDKLDAAGRSR